jgi:hypothetical protein
MAPVPLIQQQSDNPNLGQARRTAKMIGTDPTGPPQLRYFFSHA